MKPITPTKQVLSLLTGLLLCFPFSVLAQNEANYRAAILDGESQINCYFGYPDESSAVRYPQGRAVFIKSSDMNSLELSDLDAFIRSALSDSMTYVRRIRMIGYCSIEGDYSQNERLARRRAEGMRSALRDSYPGLSKFPITVSWVPEDWETLSGLLACSDIAERSEALTIIGKVSDVSTRKNNLKKLNGGTPYRQMSEQLFPLLRRVEICVEYDVPRILEDKCNRQLSREQFEIALEEERARLLAEKEIAVEDAQQKIYNQLGGWSREMTERKEDELPEAETITAMQLKLNDLRVLRRKLCPLCEDVIPFFTIKTNVLYDLTATFNLGMEFKLTRKLSLDVPVSHNPFTFGGRRKWKHTLIQPELRYWPKIVSAGHFFGAHVHLASYNVANVPGVSKTKDHRYEGWLLGPGVSYGYQHALSDYWAIEGTIGAGYAYSEYEKFDYKDANEKIGRNQKHYVGLTKVALNIIYKFRK